MGLKEVWERYQLAATFAEAGEDKMALHFLEDDSKEEASPGNEKNSAPQQGKGILRPSHAES